VSTANSVLTIMAHADDAELWAGGALARHAQDGARDSERLARALTSICRAPLPRPRAPGTATRRGTAELSGWCPILLSD